VEYLMHSKELLTENLDILIIGSGYGTEIGGRVTGIETSFLDILVEQGIIGLTLWLILCLLVYYYYHKAHKRGRHISTIDRSLMGIFVGVLLLTNINPFINNPIGIVFFLILLILSREKGTGPLSH
jgi:O-antigen ligase